MSELKSAYSELRKFPQFSQLKPRQKRFIAAYVTCELKIEPAAKKIGLEPKTAYNWAKNAEYLQVIELAKHVYEELYAATLRNDMFDTAVNGHSKPIVYKGKITGYYREKNVEERKFIMSGLDQRFRQNFQVANVQGPISVNFTFAPNSEKVQRDLDVTNQED
jgi:hypothetical protein